MKRILVILLLALPCLAQNNNARMLSGVNVVTLASYPFVPLDATRLVAFVSSNPVNAVLPPGNVLGFGAGTEFDALNIGPATATIVCTCLIYSGTAPAGASSLSLSAGQGVQLFATGLNYFALIEGSSILGLLGSTNAWTGSNTFNGATVFNGSINGIAVLGTQGGAGAQGYIQFATGSFTQNAVARFDSSGDLVNSFYTDSGAIGAYTGVNGFFSPSYNTNGSGSGFVGISQGTLPGSCNGGVDTLYADTSSTLLVDCKNQSGTTFYAYEVEAQPFFDATGLTSTQTPTLQTAAPTGSQWRFNVNANQVGTCSVVGPGAVVIKVAYTDSGGLQTVTVATLTFVSAGVAAAGGSLPFRVNSTNNILMSATYTACTTPNGSTYDIHAWLERVK